MSAWKPIETAPKDGSPVWVRGNNWGMPTRGIHCCWAWFDGHNWISAVIDADGQSELHHLTHWMPLAAALAAVGGEVQG